jgi:hypothetical protein
MRLEFTGARWSQDDSGFWISLKVENPFEARRFLATKKEKKYVADIKEYRERRSLDANAYMWVLVGKLSGKLGLPPEEIYRAAIRDVGDNYEVMPVRNDALERWKTIWQSNGLGWLCEEIGPSKLDGYTNVRNFYGSSAYDKAQMSRLIDNIVQDCKAQCIETLTPAELARLTEEWR